MSVNAVNPNGSLTRIAGGTLYADMPIGTIVPYGGSTAPSGFLLCSGQAVSRTIYADLFKAIGTAFGSGDGSSTFNLPDLRGKFAEGTPSGGTLGASVAAGLPNITAWSGDTYIRTNDGGAGKGGAFQSGYQANASTFGSSTAGALTALSFDASKSNSIYGASSTVQPPAVNVNYIIKAIQTAVPRDIQAAVDEQMNTKLEVDTRTVLTFTQGAEQFGSSDNVTDTRYKNGMHHVSGLLKILASMDTSKHFCTLPKVPERVTSTGNLMWALCNGSDGKSYTIRISSSNNVGTMFLWIPTPTADTVCMIDFWYKEA